jgi:lipopolysaccharide transport system ATP-binding protein
MKRAEIKRKFDEIVAFSGVEKFIDTPIKRYSTGMTVRLAFSVAAHLETEVLLVDEVLAVGDLDFQKKCLDKMKDVTTQGRTVLFVSHNMAAVRGLCQRGILLEDGKVAIDSDVDSAIRRYVDREESLGAVVAGDALLRLREGVFGRQDPLILPLEVSVQNAEGRPQSSFRSTDSVFVSTCFKVSRWANDVRVVVRLVDDLNQEMLLTQTVDDESEAQNPHKDPGTYLATVQLPSNLFGSRRYYVSISLSSSKNEEIHLNRVLHFDVEFQAYNNVHYGAGTLSFFRPRLTWRVGMVDGALLPSTPE